MPASSSTRAVDAARAALLAWYRQHGRRLPWRGLGDPYAIWVSEVMLQQTQVATVVPYFQRWLATFPTLRQLATADPADVLRAWQGLGYYARARQLHAAARRVMDHGGGQLPRTAAELSRLPGIGAYTAGAVASIAFGERVPAVDGNVVRVLCRWAGLDGRVTAPATRRAVRDLAAVWADHRAPGNVNQALMDLGATVCTPQAPACRICPLAADCVALAYGRQAELPAARPRARARPEHCFALVLWPATAADRWLVGRRPAEGLLGGLWEFPLLPADAAADPVALAAATYGLALRRPSRGRPLRHVFTHIDRRVTPVQAEVADPSRPDGGSYREWRWVTPGELAALPASAFMRKLVRAVSAAPVHRSG